MMLTPDMLALIELEAEKERLDKEIKEKKKIVLAEMKQHQLTDIDHNGTHIRLVETTRNTIRDKAALAAFVRSRPALSSCVQTEIKADVEMMRLAISLGDLSQDEFDAHGKVSTSASVKVGK